MKRRALIFILLIFLATPWRSTSITIRRRDGSLPPLSSSGPSVTVSPKKEAAEETTQLHKHFELPVKFNLDGGVFLKVDLHVHAPVKNIEIPPGHESYETSTSGTFFSAPVLPYVEEAHASYVDRDEKGFLVTDRLYDQAVVPWPFIRQVLEEEKFDFVVMSGHDELPEKLDVPSPTEAEFPLNFGMARAVETRWERHPETEKKMMYQTLSAANGAHVLHIDGDWDRMNVIMHPNIALKDRLDPSYYTMRERGEEVGNVAGVPYLPMNFIEVYNHWVTEYEEGMPECDGATGACENGMTTEAKGYFSTGPSTSHTSSFVRRMPISFALDKWDAALSRGLRIWGTATSDAFVKRPTHVQVKACDELRETLGESFDPMLLPTETVYAIRAKMPGHGYLRVYLGEEPRRGNDVDASSERRSKVPEPIYSQREQIFQALERGEFYAVVRPSPSLLHSSRMDEFKVTHVRSAPGTYQVGFHDPNRALTEISLDCFAVVDHGRVIANTVQISRVGDVANVLVEIDKIREYAASDGHQLTYLRLQCQILSDRDDPTQPNRDTETLHTGSHAYASHYYIFQPIAVDTKARMRLVERNYRIGIEEPEQDEAVVNHHHRTERPEMPKPISRPASGWLSMQGGGIREEGDRAEETKSDSGPPGRSISLAARYQSESWLA